MLAGLVNIIVIRQNWNCRQILINVLVSDCIKILSTWVLTSGQTDVPKLLGTWLHLFIANLSDVGNWTWQMNTCAVLFMHSDQSECTGCTVQI